LNRDGAALMLNWDRVMPRSRRKAVSDGYAKLPKIASRMFTARILLSSAGGKTEWAAMGKASLTGRPFRALAKDGYRGTVSLETHWTGGGTPENRPSEYGRDESAVGKRARSVNGGV